MLKKFLISSLAALLVIIMMITSSFASENETFTDVKKKDWYYDAVMYCYNAGVITGMGNGKFEPKSNMTRAQFVTILSRLSYADTAGLGDLISRTEVSGVNKLVRFSDVKSSDWFADAVGWAVQIGVVNGYEEKGGVYFKPNNALSRQELAKLIVAYLDYLEYKMEGTPLVDSFSDSKKFPSWSKNYIESLRLSGLVGGDDKGNFNPSSTASRAEVATILMRYIDAAPDMMYTNEKEFVRYNKCRRHGKVDIIISRSADININTLSDFLLDSMYLKRDYYIINFDPNTVDEMLKNILANESASANETEFKFRITNNATLETTPEFCVPVSITKALGSNEFSPVLDCPNNFSVSKSRSLAKSIKDEFDGKSININIEEGFSADSLKKDIVNSVTDKTPGLVTIEFENEEKVLSDLSDVFDSMSILETRENAVTVRFKLYVFSPEDRNYINYGYDVSLSLNLTKTAGFSEALKLIETLHSGTLFYDDVYPADERLEKDILNFTEYFTSARVENVFTKSEIEDTLANTAPGCIAYFDVYFDLNNERKDSEIYLYTMIGVKKSPIEYKSGEDFFFVKDGKPACSIIISENGSYKQWGSAEAIQKKIYDLSGVFVPIIREDMYDYEHVSLGNPVCIGETGTLPSEALGEATSYQYVVNTFGRYFAVAGRTEGGHNDAADYAEKNIVKDGNNVIIKSSSMGTFDRSLKEAYHAFGDVFHTSFYGDPYRFAGNAKNSYENEKIFNDIVEFGVVEIPFYSKGYSDQDVEYTRKLFEKFAEKGISIRFYPLLDCFESSDFIRNILSPDRTFGQPLCRYRVEEEYKKISSAYEQFQRDIRKTPLEDYEAKAELCRNFIDYYKANAPYHYSTIESAVRKAVETYGDIDNIFQWGYYDEPADYCSYMENQIIIELFNKYDERQRPVYINQNPLTDKTFFDGNDEYLKMTSFVDLDYLCYDRYPFNYENWSYGIGIMDFQIEGYENPDGHQIILSEEEAKNITPIQGAEIRYDTVVGDNVMGDESFYHNYEMNRNYAIDSSIDCGIILAGMKVGGDADDPGCSEITEDYAKWETNLIAAYNYRYYESYVYYPVHDFSMVQIKMGDEMYVPTFRWQLMKERNNYLNVVCNLFTYNKLDAVFHLPDEDGSQDIGTVKYYPYHGLGVIDGCDVVISFYDDGKYVLTDKRCDCDDGDAHTIVIHDFDPNTQFFDASTETWLPASSCPGLTLNGTSANIVMERASQLIFRK